MLYVHWLSKSEWECEREWECLEIFLKGYGSAVSVGLVSWLLNQEWQTLTTSTIHINGGEIIYITKIRL